MDERKELNFTVRLKDNGFTLAWGDGVQRGDEVYESREALTKRLDSLLPFQRMTKEGLLRGLEP